MTNPSAPTSDVDFFSDDILLNPYPTYAQIRELAPVVWMEKMQVFAITRYADIQTAFNNPLIFSSEKVAFNDAMNDALKGTSLATDPPEHTQLRKTILAPLIPRALKSIEENVTLKAETLMDKLVEQGSFDAIQDIARAFPLEVVTDMLGVQGEAREKALRWGDAAFNVLGPMNDRTIREFPVAGELFGFCAQVKAEDLNEGSLGRGIFEAAERGEIARESCGPIIHQYIAAGLESTIAAIGNTFFLWAKNPDQYALVVADNALVKNAFNESLRLEPPLSLLGRLVKSDVTIGGITIPAGSQVALMTGAGNHDPRKYENPTEYFIARNPMDHFAFGQGIHTCAGQNLARIEAHAILSAFVKRIKRFDTGTAIRKLANMTRSLESLPVTFVEKV